VRRAHIFNRNSVDFPYRLQNKIRGFTAVEVLLVLAIAGILVTIAGMSAVSFIRDATLSQMRDQLLQNIEEARSRSITSVPYGIQFNSANATQYSLIRLQDGTCINSTGNATLNCGGNTTSCATSQCDSVLLDGCNMAANQYCQSGNFAVQNPSQPTTILNTIKFNSGYIANLNFTGAANGTYIWFDRKGMPHDNSWNTPAGVTNITVLKGAANKSITIDTAGRVTYEQ
jgi:prepilin-type N-terminal cleavage/methylation domain-containing protein